MSQGGNLSALSNFRALYESQNFTRHIIGFDTFEGFQGVNGKDGVGLAEGDLGVEEDWHERLIKIIDLIKQDNPLSHLMKTETIKGDIRQTWERFKELSPHLVIALAIFDMDIYEPTLHVLRDIRKFMPTGSILLFDEFATDLFPGETAAVKEVLGIQGIHYKRSPLHPTAAYFVIP